MGQSAALQMVAEAQLAKESFEEAASAAKDRRGIWKALGCRKEEGDAVLQLATGSIAEDSKRRQRAKARIHLGSTVWPPSS